MRLADELREEHALIERVLGSLLSFAAALAIVFVGWGRFGTSPGKKLLGLAVVADGVAPGEGIGAVKALVRWIGYFLSALLLGIGFLLIVSLAFSAAISRRKRAIATA